MPLRGESVGSAYVRIYADGSEVPGDIRRSLEEAEPSVREAGERHGKTYGDEFDKSYRASYRKHFQTTKGSMFDDLNKELIDSLAKLKLSDNFFKSKEWSTFLTRLDDEFGAAGRLAGKRLEEEFRDSADLTRLGDQIDQIGVRVRAAQAEILAESERESNESWARKLEEAYRLNAEFDRKQRILLARYDEEFDRSVRFQNDKWREIYEEAYRLHAEFNRRDKQLRDQYDEDFERSVRSHERGVHSLWRSLEAVNDSLAKIERGERTAFSRNDLERILRTLNTSMNELDTNIDGNSRNLRDWNLELTRSVRRLDEASPAMRRLSFEIDRGGNIVGKLFGKGSRNNFLNFFGTVTGGLVSMFRVIPEGLGWFSRLGREMQTAFNSGGGGLIGSLSALQTGVTSIGAALATAVVAGTAFVLFLSVLGALLGPIVSILSGLVGIVVALASSLVMGLAAALGVVGPLLLGAGGVVAGVIALTMAIKDASDASPELKKSISGIRDEASHLWDVFKDRALVNLPGLLQVANHMLERMEPLVDGAGRGFSRFLQNVIDAGDSPAFTAFFNRFGVFLPHAMDRMGSILGHLAEGFAGIFRASTPLANRFLKYLDDITARFADWANSPQGQREIKQFLKEAGDAAKSLGDFLGDAWDWFWKIVTAADAEGNTLWERIGGQFEEWAKWIDAHPDEFQQWMDDADDLATSIGKVVDGLQHLIDTLDSPENRRVGNDLVAALGDAMGAIGLFFDAFAAPRLIDLFLRNLEPVKEVLAVFGLGFKGLGMSVWYIVGGEWVGDLVHGIDVAIRAAGGLIAGWAQSFWTSVTSGFSGMGGAHGIGANIIDTSSITKAMTNALETLGRMPAGVSRIATRVGNAFSGVPGQIRGYVSGIPSMVQGFFSRLPIPLPGIENRMAGAFKGLGTDVGQYAHNAVDAVSGFFDNLPGKVAGIPGRIVAQFQGLGAAILRAIGDVVVHVGVDWPDLGGHGAGVKHAAGGVFDRATLGIFGEAGPEAIVPLNRPLSQVDPSVRALSAFAQGIETTNTTHQRTVDASGWQIVTPSEDPRIVAVEVLDALVHAL